MPSLRNFSMLTLLISVSALGGGSAAFAAGTPSVASSRIDPRGQVLSLSCAGCHGTNGRSSGIIPSISDKSPDYIEAAMKDFKSGARVSTVMGRHAKGYSDEEIHLIAEYFGAINKTSSNKGGRQ